MSYLMSFSKKKCNITYHFTVIVLLFKKYITVTVVPLIYASVFACIGILVQLTNSQNGFQELMATVKLGIVQILQVGL